MNAYDKRSAEQLERLVQLTNASSIDTRMIQMAIQIAYDMGRGDGGIEQVTKTLAKLEESRNGLPAEGAK